MGSRNHGWRMAAASTALIGGIMVAGYAGAQNMDGLAVLATFGSVAAFIGMLGWPEATSAVIAGGLVIVMLASGAYAEAAGLTLYAAGVAGLVARRRRARATPPERHHLKLVHSA